MHIVCPKCKKRYKVVATLAGKHVRCRDPECRAVFVARDVDVAEEPSAEPASSPDSATILPSPPPPPSSPFPLSTLDSPDVPSAESEDPIAATMPAMESGALPSLFEELLSAEESPPTEGGPPVLLAPLPQRSEKSNVMLYGGIAVGAVALVGLIVVLVVTLGDGGGDPLGWAGWCIPPNAKVVAFVNVEKVARSDVFRLVKSLAAKGGPQAGMLPFPGGFPGMSRSAPFDPAQLTTAIDSITEVRLAVTDDGNPIVVVRTKEDIPLERAAATGLGLRPEKQTSPSTPSEPKTAGSVSYLPMGLGSGSGFCAKIAPNTFCSTAREKDLQDAIARMERKEAPPLDEALRQAWDRAKGDVVVAMLKPKESGLTVPAPSGRKARSGLPPTPDWVSAGITTDTSLGLQATLGFPSEAEAGKLVSGFNDGIRSFEKHFKELEKQFKEIESKFGKLSPEEQKKANDMKGGLQKMLQLARALRVSQDGKVVRFNGTWAVRDVEGLIQQSQDMDKAMRSKSQ